MGYEMAIMLPHYFASNGELLISNTTCYYSIFNLITPLFHLLRLLFFFCTRNFFYTTGLHFWLACYKFVLII
jgi:hypothetical protein